MDKDKPQTKTISPQTGEGWAAYIATGLELILRAKTLAEVKRIARQRLLRLADPKTGMHHVSDDLRRRWLTAALSGTTPDNKTLELGADEERGQDE